MSIRWRSACAHVRRRAGHRREDRVVKRGRCCRRGPGRGASQRRPSPRPSTSGAVDDLMTDRDALDRDPSRRSAARGRPAGRPDRHRTRRSAPRPDRRWPGRQHRQTDASCPRGCCPECGRPHERQPAHVHAPDRALVQVIGDDGLAGPLIGILADPTRAEHMARADLEQAALQLVARAGAAGLGCASSGSPFGYNGAAAAGATRLRALARSSPLATSNASLGAWRPYLAGANALSGLPSKHPSAPFTSWL